MSAVTPTEQHRPVFRHVELVILDFDGVIADSELLSNTLLAEFLTGEGLPTTTEQSMARYMGRRWADNQERIARAFGRPLTADFLDRHRAFFGDRMRRDVLPVPGVGAFLAANPNTRFCVASSSSHDWLNHVTTKFGFGSHFDGNLFSATEVANGKPAPDIFLHAARRMDVAPARCAVVEDSAAGIEGAIAAGMTAIGFLGGAHIRDGHADKLRAAGAQAIAHSYDDVARSAGLRTGPAAPNITP